MRFELTEVLPSPVFKTGTINHSVTLPIPRLALIIAKKMPLCYPEAMKIKIKKFYQDAILPSYQSTGAAGFDFYAHLDSPQKIPAGATKTIGTGVGVELPVGFELQVRPRSGLAAKFSITILNGVGTIDSDYRGEIMVLLENRGVTDFVVEPNMRIAQGVIAKVPRVDWDLVAELSASTRSADGFGSTGLK